MCAPIFNTLSLGLSKQKHGSIKANGIARHIRVVRPKRLAERQKDYKRVIILKLLDTSQDFLNCCPTGDEDRTYHVLVISHNFFVKLCPVWRVMSNFCCVLSLCQTEPYWTAVLKFGIFAFASFAFSPFPSCFFLAQDTRRWSTTKCWTINV